MGTCRSTGVDRLGNFDVLLFVRGSVRSRSQGEQGLEFRPGGDYGLRLLLDVRGASMVGLAAARGHRLWTRGDDRG